MTPDELNTMLESFKERRILLIGDSIRDENVYCKVRGISAETPTMVLEIIEEHHAFGGAACVRRNLEELGATVTHLTNTKMPVKRRYWVSDYKMLQIDSFQRETDTLSALEYLDHLDGMDAVVVADYRHGYIQEHVAKQIVHHTKLPLFVAAQVSQEESNHHWYYDSNVTIVANKKEYALLKIGSDVPKECVVTAGSDGAYKIPYMQQRDERGAALYVKSNAIQVVPVDTCGAGDAFLAAYALSGSLEFSNLWAGLSTTVKGANPPSIEMAMDWVSNRQ